MAKNKNQQETTTNTNSYHTENAYNKTTNSSKPQNKALNKTKNVTDCGNYADKTDKDCFK